MNTDGTELLQLTSTTGGIGAIHPALDLSGQKIVFASDRDLIAGGNTDENFEIFTIQVNGTGLTQLTRTTGGNSLCAGGGPGETPIQGLILPPQESFSAPTETWSAARTPTGMARSSK